MCVYLYGFKDQYFCPSLISLVSPLCSMTHNLSVFFQFLGGDVVSGNGLGSISKFGSSFPDENFKAKHGAAGFLSMANSGLS